MRNGRGETKRQIRNPETKQRRRGKRRERARRNNKKKNQRKHHRRQETQTGDTRYARRQESAVRAAEGVRSKTAEAEDGDRAHTARRQKKKNNGQATNNNTGEKAEVRSPQKAQGGERRYGGRVTDGPEHALDTWTRGQESEREWASERHNSEAKKGGHKRRDTRERQKAHHKETRERKKERNTHTHTHTHNRGGGETEAMDKTGTQKGAWNEKKNRKTRRQVQRERSR